MTKKQTQLNELSKIMLEQNKKFKKEIVIKNKTEILELKSTITEKNSVESFKSRLSHAEKTISNMADKTLEITNSEEQEEKQSGKD